jgi:hypothetical protein
MFMCRTCTNVGKRNYKNFSSVGRDSSRVSKYGQNKRYYQRSKKSKKTKRRNNGKPLEKENSWAMKAADNYIRMFHLKKTLRKIFSTYNIRSINGKMDPSLLERSHFNSEEMYKTKLKKLTDIKAEIKSRKCLENLYLEEIISLNVKKSV